eukprot:15449717-Alexandrium_andersonii.AAC.1
MFSSCASSLGSATNTCPHSAHVPSAFAHVEAGAPVLVHGPLSGAAFAWHLLIQLHRAYRASACARTWVARQRSQFGG